MGSSECVWIQGVGSMAGICRGQWGCTGVR